MSSTPSTMRVIFDTRDNLMHYAVPANYYREPFELEGIEEFVAYLNKKAGTDRFTVVAVTPLLPRGRAGLTRHYATFMKANRTCASAPR